MAKESIALLDLLRKLGMDEEVDFLREGVRAMAQSLMELEVSEQIGAHHHERSPIRSNQRNGYRPREWDTRVGTIDLAIPKLRKGSCQQSSIAYQPCIKIPSGSPNSTASSSVHSPRSGRQVHPRQHQ